MTVALAGPFLATPTDAQRGRPIGASVENGRYHQGGVAFDVPADWKYQGTVTGNTPFDETAQWTDPQSGIALFVYRSKQKAAPGAIVQLVNDVIANKTKQRERQGYQIFTPENRVLFFATLGPDQLAEFQPKFDKVVQSATVP